MNRSQKLLILVIAVFGGGLAAYTCMVSVEELCSEGNHYQITLYDSITSETSLFAIICCDVKSNNMVETSIYEYQILSVAPIQWKSQYVSNLWTSRGPPKQITTIS